MGTVAPIRPLSERLHPTSDERALLEIVLDGYAAAAAYLLEPEDLHEPEHAAILRAARAVHEAGAIPNAATVIEQLRAMDRQVSSKIVVDLACPEVIPQVGNVFRHARAVRLASRARAELACHERAIMLYRAGRFEEASELEREMAARATAVGTTQPVLVSEEAYEVYTGERAKAAAGTVQRKKVDLGWAPWRRTIGPMPGGSLFVIGAAPGVGKSSLILVTMIETARPPGELAKGKRVGIVSIEDAPEIWGARALAYESGIWLDDVTDGRFGGVEPEALEALGRLQAMGISLVYAPGAPIEQVEQHMTALVREHGCELLAVDYLQAIRVGRGDPMERTSEAGARVKATAARLGVPVILASQLSRPEPGKEYDEPQISRLRYSGDIEAMAEVIAMVWRTAAPSDDRAAAEEISVRLGKVKWRRPGALIQLARQASGLIGEVE